MGKYRKYISALIKCAIEHEDDRTFTGQIIVSDLCRDTADLLEKIEKDQEPIVENVGERLIKREINKTYKVFCIGGDPKKIAFLANELRKKIDDLQDSGWEIDSVDLINNTRAWDSDKQMYVETPEYVIRAKKG